jgi:hypothetical protein
MKISLYPTDLVSPKCLVLVGGSGDTSEGFDPLVQAISNKLIDYSICTFNFSTSSKTESILDVQARELNDVMGQLTTDNRFKQIDIFATSMGAYATIKLLQNNHYSKIIRNVILYDPADYYLSAKFADSDDVTWSGPQQYVPKSKVISDELKEIEGKCKITVVHLTLRNYGQDGYIDNSYSDRSIDHSGGYPRLCTDMVRAMFDKIPLKNKGRYIEESNVPHAILRDGNIKANIEQVSSTIIDIISK